MQTYESTKTDQVQSPAIKNVRGKAVIINNVVVVVVQSEDQSTDEARRDGKRVRRITNTEKLLRVRSLTHHNLAETQGR